MKPAIQLACITPRRRAVLQACQDAWEAQSGYEPRRTPDVTAVIWLKGKGLIHRISLREWIPTPAGSTLLQVLNHDLDAFLEWIKLAAENLPPTPHQPPEGAGAPVSHVSVEPSQVGGAESST